MEVIAVQNQFQAQYGVLGTRKVKDWSASAKATPYQQSSASVATHKIKHHSISRSVRPRLTNTTTTATIINANANNITNTTATLALKHQQQKAAATSAAQEQQQQLYFSANADSDTEAVQQLSLRLLDELRAAKSRHLTCTEVSLPCDLTMRIAAEIVRVSAKEPCGLRGCTIYIEFEDEPLNSRRIAALSLDDETVPTFEIYLTLRQDQRGWISALLPQFMKHLGGRSTITISPDFSITKHKLYAATTPAQPQQVQLPTLSQC